MSVRKELVCEQAEIKVGDDLQVYLVGYRMDGGGGERSRKRHKRGVKKG